MAGLGCLFLFCWWFLRWWRLFVCWCLFWGRCREGLVRGVEVSGSELECFPFCQVSGFWRLGFLSFIGLLGLCAHLRCSCCGRLGCKV